jgi:transcriptional regulator with XRE-family HTH domain
MNFSENLKRIRTEKGITQGQLAKACGVTNQAISNYETGIREPSLDIIAKQVSVLEVSADELLGIKPDDKRTVSAKT